MTEITESNFEQEVLQSKEPVLVDFHATWCGPCKMIAPLLEEISRELSGRAKIVKADIDTNPTLSQQYKITAVPTLVYFFNGKVAQQKVGTSGKREIISTLEKLAQKH
jgi:thioredoxin 1